MNDVTKDEEPTAEVAEVGEGNPAEEAEKNHDASQSNGMIVLVPQKGQANQV